MFRPLNIAVFAIFFGSLPVSALTNVSPTNGSTHFSPNLQATTYARLSEKDLYTMSTLIFAGKVVSIDNKPLINSDIPFTSVKPKSSTQPASLFLPDQIKAYRPIWKVLFSVDRVYLGTVEAGKTITVYVLDPEGVAVGDRGTWFVNANAHMVWEGRSGRYWKKMPMLPGGPAQARREFKQDLADKYKSDRESYAKTLLLKAKMPIKP